MEAWKKEKKQRDVDRREAGQISAGRDNVCIWAGLEESNVILEDSKSWL